LLTPHSDGSYSVSTDTQVQQREYRTFSAIEEQDEESTLGTASRSGDLADDYYLPDPRPHSAITADIPVRTGVMNVRIDTNAPAVQREYRPPFDGNVVLSNLTLNVAPSSLCVIVGMTGSGKSTLLQGGLLGECTHITGRSEMEGRVSYVSQSAWIQNATLRDNILFGSPFNKERFDSNLSRFYIYILHFLF
jgi:ABC-type multidrug transport system fused ATPase/permease subunit